MRILLMLILAVGAMTGCQSRESGDQAANANATNGVASDRKEASRKLIVESTKMLQEKNLKGAIGALEMAIKFDPQSPDAYLYMANILLNVQEYEHAVDFLEQATKAVPDNATIYYLLAMANRMDGKKLPAVLAARRSAELYHGANDEENAKRALGLLQSILATPDQAGKEAAANEGSKATTN